MLKNIYLLKLKLQELKHKGKVWQPFRITELVSV